MTRLIALVALVDLELSAAPCHDSCHAPNDARLGAVVSTGFLHCRIEPFFRSRRRNPMRGPSGSLGLDIGRDAIGAPGRRGNRVVPGGPRDLPVVAFGVGEIRIAALEELRVRRFLRSFVTVAPASRARRTRASTSSGPSTVMMTELRMPPCPGSGVARASVPSWSMPNSATRAPRSSRR